MTSYSRPMELSRSREERMTRSTLFCLVALVTLVMAGSAHAGGMASARSVAMGGAHIGLASGIDAARYNPANLGLANHHQGGLELLGFGANISNNAFSLADYNKYSGALLTAQDKADILAKIPDDGLHLDVDAEASAMAISAGPFVLTATAVGKADVNLNRDIFDLILNGNTYADTINVTGSYSDVISYGTAALSYGMPIYTHGQRQLAIGATAKYIRGIAIEQVTELQGMAATYATGFAGDGKAIARTATGGSGMGLDLGVALKLNNHYTVGARVENMVSRIKWDHQTEERGYIFSFDTMTVANMEDDFVTSDDYTKDIPAFTTTLPANMVVGIARTSGKLLWAVDWQQGLKKEAGATTKPRISVGAEYSLIGLLPLRAGYATGGGRTASFSFGTGLHLLGYYLDVAGVTGSSFSGYSAKGLNFAVSTGFHF
jgi:hypothetical protein